MEASISIPLPGHADLKYQIYLVELDHGIMTLKRDKKMKGSD